MRKILLLLTVAILGFSAGAEQITITPEATSYSGNGFKLTTAKNDGGTAPFYNTDLRIYAKGSVTIAATVADITINKIVFHLSAQGLKRLAPITASAGTVATQSAGDETVTWTGSDTSVTFTVGDKADFGSEGSAKAGQLCFTSVTIDYTSAGGVILKDPELSFPESSYQAELGKEFTTPTLSKLTDAEATYKSSDVSVATVDATTGAITLVAEGETTITARTEANESYTAGEASYKLVVIDPSIVRYEDFITLESFTFTGGNVYGVSSYTSNSTQVKYATKAYRSGGLQINTDKSSSAKLSGLVSVSNPNNLIIKKVVVVCSAAKASNLVFDVSNQPGEATSDGSAGTDASVRGAADGVSITGVISEDQKEAIFTPEGDYLYFYLHTTANTVVTKMEVYYEALPEGATAYINDAEVPSEYTLQGAAVTVILKAPEGEDIWYKFTEATTQESAQAEEGFQEYPEAGITIEKIGTLEFYTVLNDRESTHSTIEFKGTAASISEISAADGAATEWYDLSGRRVASPAKGVFIKKTGSKVSKVVF